LAVYILHLETATKVCSVALSKNGELISFTEDSDDNYTHGEKLNLFIEDVIEKSSVKLDQLSAISISSGPGSYTGLRIGAATAKGLCFALETPLISIDSLSSLAAIAYERHRSSNLCAVIDARRLEVYNLILDKNFKKLKEITADVVDDSSYAKFRPFVFFGDGAEKLSELWSGKECTFDADIKSSAKGQVELSYKKYLNSEFEDVAYWEPYYLKEFIAGKKSK